MRHNELNKAVVVCYVADGDGYPVVVEYATREDRRWIGWELIITTVVEVWGVIKLDRPYSDFDYDLSVGFESILNSQRIKLEHHDK